MEKTEDGSRSSVGEPARANCTAKASSIPPFPPSHSKHGLQNDLCDVPPEERDDVEGEKDDDGEEEEFGTDEKGKSCARGGSA